jgi:GH18 family chitinase
LCDNIKTLITTYGFDGVDLDLEAGESQTTQDNFVIALRNTINSDNVITMAMSSYATSVSTSVFSNYVNFGCVMCYDFWQKADQNPNMYPHSTYIDTIAAMQLRITQGYPKAKLCMGYPTYGYSTDGTNGRLASYHWHDIVAVNLDLASNPANDYFVMNGYATWINNVNTVKQKAQWVIDNDLAGMMCFSVGYDDIGTAKSLMAAVNSVL